MGNSAEVTCILDCLSSPSDEIYLALMKEPNNETQWAGEIGKLKEAPIIVLISSINSSEFFEEQEFENRIEIRQLIKENHREISIRIKNLKLEDYSVYSCVTLKQ